MSSPEQLANVRSMVGEVRAAGFYARHPQILIDGPGGNVAGFQPAS
jgi:hypothetical protein